MDKLTILNRALVATGNSMISLNDGSDEWQVVEIEFDRRVEELLSGHGWPFGRRKATLVPTTPVEAVEWQYAFALPTDLFHLRKVFIAGNPTTEYRIYGKAIVLDADGSTGDVQVEYISQPEADENWHAQATRVLTLYIEVGCLRGLNEDLGEASKRLQEAEWALANAKQVTASENPSTNVYQGGATAARRMRRA